VLATVRRVGSVGGSERAADSVRATGQAHARPRATRRHEALALGRRDPDQGTFDEVDRLAAFAEERQRSFHELALAAVTSMPGLGVCARRRDLPGAGSRHCSVDLAPLAGRAGRDPSSRRARRPSRTAEALTQRTRYRPLRPCAQEATASCGGPSWCPGRSTRLT
jgi:hypothetical protein